MIAQFKEGSGLRGSDGDAGGGYNAKGQRERITYRNSTETSYAYDPETFRLISLVTRRSNSDKCYQDITYVYDPVGNITKIRDDSHNRVFTNTGPVEPEQTYTYDALYRLTNATGRMHTALVNTPFFNDPSSFKQSRHTLLNDQNLIAQYSHQYTYDASGNLTVIQQTQTNPFTRRIDIDQTSNRGLLHDELIPNPNFDDYFDANGNQKKHSHLPATSWNYRDNLASATVLVRSSGRNDAEYYVYDAAGQRVRKVKEVWIYNQMLIEVEEKVYLGSLEIKRKRLKFPPPTEMTMPPFFERYTLNVMDDKQRIATVHTWTQHDYPSGSPYVPTLNTPHIRYQYANHLGSASLELDGATVTEGANPRIISYEEYYPYGDTSFIAGQNQTEITLKEYRYTGKERDDSTGFYYYGARYYAPWLARWLSADPAGPIDGLNLYQYVSGNPVRMNDPGGMEGVDVDLDVDVDTSPEIESTPGAEAELAKPKSATRETKPKAAKPATIQQMSVEEPGEWDKATADLDVEDDADYSYTEKPSPIRIAPEEDEGIYLKDLERSEGNVPYMYLCTSGKVTVGIGNMLPDKKSAQDLPFVNKNTGVLATQQEIENAYTAVKGMKKGMEHSKYKQTPNLELDNSTIENLAKSRIKNEFIPSIKKAFPNFDIYPEDAKKVILDIAFNVGPGRQGKKTGGGIQDYKQLAAAAEAALAGKASWATAAQHAIVSNPNNLKNREERNDWRMQTLLQLAPKTK